MGNFNSSRASYGVQNTLILAIRLFAGLTMLTHGWPKLDRLMSSDTEGFMNFLGLGPAISLVLVVIAEFLCSIFLMLGLLTRLSCIPPIIAMLVAAFVAHGSGPFQEKELSILYLAIYMIILVLGSGKFSLDALFAKKIDKY